MERRSTIFALSSANGRAGVCVFRVSGDAARSAVEELTGAPVPQPRRATLRDIRLRDGTLIDRGLVIWFEGSRSFSGEDVAEFQLHGSPAVIAAFTGRLSELPGLRAADP
ncbi:MAG: tRNA uridine-5-carboxymethylaminomethyl(34) synthesis GTPase MnmE, partial [Micropepsaceae bacterium]